MTITNKRPLTWLVPAGAAAIVLVTPRAAWAQGLDQSGQIVEFLRPSGVVAALIIITVAIVILRVINSLSRRLSERFTEHRLLAQQVNTVLRFIVYMVSIVLVVTSVISLEREAVIALGGIMAVTIGFALKDLASSVLAGITILFDRPFQVGDRVTVAGFYGEIQNIGLRSVRMVTLDDSIVTIPNNRFLTEVVVSGNAGALDMQIVMDFFVAADSDVRKVKRIVYEAAITSQYVYLEKPVVVLVADVLETNYYATRMRCKAYVLDVRYEMAFESDVTERVKQGFLEEGVRPPSVIHSAAEKSEAIPAQS